MTKKEKDTHTHMNIHNHIHRNGDGKAKQTQVRYAEILRKVNRERPIEIQIKERQRDCNMFVYILRLRQ